ncbi:hypothetical protein BATDEDRAFT_22896 [Lichtheimia corymbifera JMRC:FSU:9682]|uniref:CUB domain-containing protein n=1 Tax=Lichtheimia corymbifera JMRC:FSU:9682 TaxID=1263082 RepID=A0A068SEY7_9FUNG|nr:hypothetical protein BATDEDRAFT_22896 [Lichtheimia corymbifera JMRC:FSU:9682]
MPFHSGPHVRKRCGETLTATTEPTELSSSFITNCEWRLEATAGSLVKLEFTMLDLICGQDYINVSSDGTVLASLCGSQLPLPIYASSTMSIAMTTGKGFHAIYQAIDTCSACGDHGTCNNGTCVCAPGFQGATCDQSIFSRSLHGAVYYPPRDSMIVYGGTTLNGLASPSLIEFHFGNMSWTTPTIASSTSPIARYGHTLFMHDGYVYCFGGKGRPGVVLSDLWRMDPETWSWEQVSFASDNRPPILIDPTVTIVSQQSNSTQMFVFGGYMATNHSMSRSIYVYDVVTGYWKNQLRKNSIGCVGAQGIYHPDTESIYYFGGLRENKSNAIFEYHIPSDLWYLDQPQSKFQERIQGAAVLFQKDQALLFGGQTPNDDDDTTSDNHASCFYADANVYDFVCGTFSSNDMAIQSDPRMGHSLIMRNGEAWIFGGHNGIDLGDVSRVSIPSTPKRDTTQEQLCKSIRWCSTYSDCDDCQQRPYCSYTHGSCTFNDTNAHLTCPMRIPVNVGESYHGVLTDRLVFKTFVDAPNKDLVFRFSSVDNEMVAITFETMNGWQGERNENNKAITFNDQGQPYRIMNDTSHIPITSASSIMQDPTPLVGVSPIVSIKANDTRRYSGYYVYQLRNRDALPQQIKVSVEVHESTTGKNTDGSRQQQQQSDQENGGGPSKSLKIVALTLFCFACLLFFVVGVVGSRRMRRYVQENNRNHGPGIEGPNELCLELSQGNVPDVYHIKVPKRWWDSTVRGDQSAKGSTYFPMPLSSQPLLSTDQEDCQTSNSSRQIGITSHVDSTNTSSDDDSRCHHYVLNYAVLLPTPPVSMSTHDDVKDEELSMLPNITLASTLVQVDPTL